MHAKVFSIQIFQYFQQISWRVCTFVLLIIIIIKIDLQHIHVNMLMNIGVCDINMCDVLMV